MGHLCISCLPALPGYLPNLPRIFPLLRKRKLTNKAVVVAGILLEKIDESSARVTRHIDEFVHSTTLSDGMKN